MKDLYNAINALNDIVNESLNEAPPQGRQDGPGTRQGTSPKPKAPTGPAAYKNVGDFVKAVSTPGRQGVADPNQSAKNIAAAQPKPAPKPKLGGTGVGRQDGPAALRPAAAPKINPAVPAAGPVRANPINPQAMAATKAAASVVNAPKPAAPAPRAKVKATAANTKDFDKTVALQKKLGVTADGIMGPQTRAAMKAAKEKSKTARAPTPMDAGEFATARAPTPMDAGEFATAAPKAFTPNATAQANRGASQGGRTAAQAKDSTRQAVNRQSISSIRSMANVDREMGAGTANTTVSGGGKKPGLLARLFGGGKDRRAAAPAAASNRIASLPNATTTDRAGNISPDGRARQPSDAAPSLARRGDNREVAPTTQTAAAPRRSDTSFRASDGTNTVARDASGNLNVRQRVTDPDAKAALVNKVNRARDMQRLALAAGSTDPDDIRAYVNRMNRTQGTGAAGGTDPNTY